MHVQTPAIQDVNVLIPKIIRDSRGSFCETYNLRALEERGVRAAFVQDNHSVSKEKGIGTRHGRLSPGTALLNDAPECIADLRPMRGWACAWHWTTSGRDTPRCRT